MLFGNIIDRYFKNFRSAIQDPAIINIWVRLTVAEFIDIDQTKPIYVRSLAQNFYINKIEQFKVEGLTRLQLIRV